MDVQGPPGVTGAPSRNRIPWRNRLKICRLNSMTIPKVAVLATGLAVAILVGTVHPVPAQATPRASNCAGCHASDTGNVSTVTATPSTATPAAGRHLHGRDHHDGEPQWR